MTPQEHDALALKMKLLAQQVLIEWLSDLWRLRLAATPKGEREATLAAMTSKIQDGKTEYSQISLPWLDAASSDMQSAMFQEAYDEISKKILEKASAGLTPEEEARFRA